LGRFLVSLSISDVNLKFTWLCSSLLAWRRRVRLHCNFGRIPPPSIEQVLLPLNNLIVRESREIVDNWVLTDGCFDLNKLELDGWFLLFFLPQLLFSFPLLSSLLAILVFRNALVSLPSGFGGTCEWAHVLLHDLICLLLDALHVHELVLEYIDQSVAESRNDVGEALLSLPKLWLFASCN